MQRLLAFTLVCLLATAVIASPNYKSGENEEAKIEGTDITGLEYPETSHSLDIFPIVIALSEAAAANGTTVTWVTQICVNSGVCYAPEVIDLISEDDGDTWVGEVMVNDTATYINWRIDLKFPEGDTERVPEEGWGWKVWSDCWFDGEIWGGENQECVDENQPQPDDGGLFLPNIGIVASIAGITMAALIARRD